MIIAYLIIGRSKKEELNQVTKSKKSQRMIMILALSAIQVLILSILYRIINPKEFASMIYQVNANNTMRFVIIAVILFTFIASMISSSLLVSVFDFLRSGLFKKGNSK